MSVFEKVQRINPFNRTNKPPIFLFFCLGDRKYAFDMFFKILESKKTKFSRIMHSFKKEENNSSVVDLDRLLDESYTPEDIYSNIELLSSSFLRVKGDLILNIENNPKIKKLPKIFMVDGDLCLKGQNGIKNIEEVSFNVSGRLSLSKMDLSSIPKIKKVGKGLHFCYNNIKSFKNCPEVVGGNFSFFGNPIEDFSFLPKEVHGQVFCEWQKKSFLSSVKVMNQMEIDPPYFP